MGNKAMKQKKREVKLAEMNAKIKDLNENGINHTSKTEMWGSALIESSIVAGIAVSLAYLGLDYMIANLLNQFIPMPVELLRPIVFGVLMFFTEFIYDIVLIYTLH
jgi:hypothetical protein